VLKNLDRKTYNLERFNHRFRISSVRASIITSDNMSRPFQPLCHHSSILEKIEQLIVTRDYKGAMKLSEDLSSSALDGLHYFQTYDWTLLMTVVTLGYIGWMMYLVIHVLQSYASFTGNFAKKELIVHRENNFWKGHQFYVMCGCSGALPVKWIKVASGALIIVVGIVPRWLELSNKQNKYWLSLVHQDIFKPKLPMLFHLQVFFVRLSSLMVPLSTSHRTEKQELFVLHQLINWAVADITYARFVLTLHMHITDGENSNHAPNVLARLNSLFLELGPPYLLLSIGYEAVFCATLGLLSDIRISLTFVSHRSSFHVKACG
ncbi:GPI ethanolamine phosphate transferase 1-like protein, partial [Drosera capensis]